MAHGMTRPAPPVSGTCVADLQVGLWLVAAVASLGTGVLICVCVCTFTCSNGEREREREREKDDGTCALSCRRMLAPRHHEN